MIFLVRCENVECMNRISMEVKGASKRVNGISLEWVCMHCNKVNRFER